MIDAMPRPRPPHLHRQITRHGNPVWYVRVGKGPRTRLRAPYGTSEFDEQYRAAIAGHPLGGRQKAANGTLAWLWEQYRQSSAWTQKLKPSTRRMHERIMKRVIDVSGREPFSAINRKSIVAGREKRAATPAQARKFLDAMRGLFRWALDAEHIKADPTAGVKNPEKPKTQGFPAWTEEDVEAYHRRQTTGTSSPWCAHQASN